MLANGIKLGYKETAEAVEFTDLTGLKEVPELGSDPEKVDNTDLAADVKQYEMGIGDAGILAVGQSVEETTKEMLADLVDEDTELISLYYGQDVLAEDAERFSAEIEELYPDVDVDVHSGGQPIYYYVLSVE